MRDSDRKSKLDKEAAPNLINTASQDTASAFALLILQFRLNNLSWHKCIQKNKQ